MTYTQTRIPGSNDSGIWNPSINVEGNKVIVGLRFNNRRASKMDIPVEVMRVLENGNQSVHWNVDLACSVQDLLESEDALLKHGHNGFKMSHKHTVIKHFYKIMLDMLQKWKEDHEEWEQPPFKDAFMALIPLCLFGVTMQVDLDFDDFEDVKENPVL